MRKSILEEKMVEDIKEIGVEINALVTILNDMERDYERGNIDPARYFKMRLNYLKQKESAIENLDNILREKGAGALADVVAKLPTSRDDEGLRVDLERVAKEGESKGWGDIIHETIEQEKQPIVQTILRAAIKVASIIIL